MPDGNFDPASDLTPVYEDAGKKYGWDPDLLRAQTHVESGGNPYAVSDAGAEGISQFIGSTARGEGLKDPFDPHEAIPAQAKLMRENADQLGSPAMAVAAYHGGTDPSQWGEKTRAYLDAVDAEYARLKAQRQQTAQQAPPQPPAIGDQIKAARQAGYNDDEIASYLGQSKQWAPKFEAGRKAGYLDDEMFSHLGLNVTQGRPLTSKQAVAQLPMAKTEQLPAEQPPPQNGEDPTGAAAAMGWAPPAPAAPPPPASQQPSSQDAGLLAAPFQGMGAAIRGVGQTAQTIGGGKPSGQDANTVAAQPIQWGDIKQPRVLGEKFLYGLGQSAPEIAGFVGGSALAGGPETPAGLLAGGVGAAIAHAATSLGPTFGEELKTSPNDPDAAFTRAFKKTGVGSVFTGAGFAAFGLAPFQSALKNMMFQAFGVQPAVSVAETAATNVAEGKPAGDNLTEGVPGAIVGTAVPLAAHALARGLRPAGAPATPQASPAPPGARAPAAPLPTEEPAQGGQPEATAASPISNAPPPEAPPPQPAAPPAAAGNPMLDHLAAQAAARNAAREQEAKRAPEPPPPEQAAGAEAHAELENIAEGKPAEAPQQPTEQPPAVINMPAPAESLGPPEAFGPQAPAEIPTVDHANLAAASAPEAEGSQAEEAQPVVPRETPPPIEPRETAPNRAESVARATQGPSPYEPTPREPQRLVNYLRAPTVLNAGTIHETVIPGGIKDTGGDLKAILGGAKGRPGLINNKTGRSLDDAAQVAWEAGYLPGADRPDINTLLDALRDDHTGTPRYSEHDLEAADAYNVATEGNREIDRLAADHGIETKGKTREQFFDELHDGMSLDERAREIQSQTDAHEAAYREAETAAKQWVADHQGEKWRADQFYVTSQARTLADLEREYAAEKQSHPIAPAEGERGAGREEPGPAGADQGAIPEGGSPRRNRARASGQPEAESTEEVENASLQHLPRGTAAQAPSELSSMSRGEPAALQTASRSGEHDRLSRAQEAQRIESLRQGLPEAGETDRGAMRGVRGPESGNAPSGPQSPAGRDVDLPRTPPANYQRGETSDLLGKPVAEPRAKTQPEPTIRNDPNQITMPGTEPSAQQAQAARDAQGRGALQSDAAQKPADEGLFAPDTSGQGSLYSFPGMLADPEAWRRAFGPIGRLGHAAITAARKGGDVIANSLAPMRSGSVRAQKFATDFANSLRQVGYRYGEIDREIERAFKPSERAEMGAAMDAQSVFEQSLRDMPPDQHDAARVQFDDTRQGIAGLRPDQQRVLRMLDTVSQDVWERMRQRGMVAPTARGLPFYFPRQILLWSEQSGFERPGGTGGGGGSNIEPIGGNLTTRGPMTREHLTPEETEAAARAKFGNNAAILRDIRMLPSRLAEAERAMAGVDLMEQIDRVGRETGVNLVTRGDIPGLLNPADYFSIEQHPAFRRWTGAGWQAVHVSKEFEGPLRAILTKRGGDLYRGAMMLKGGVMSAIMYSPFIHLAVELGRSLPVMPGRVLTLQALRDGSRLRGDIGYMDRAIHDGMAPLGRSGWRSDPISIADQANVEGQNRFVRSFNEMRDSVARGAGAVLGPAAQEIVRHPHQALLWDQVFNLQVGLYDAMRSRWIAKGFDPDVAGAMAAHIANRYAGALPPEHLSRGANMAANLLLFSRSFTLGNLGVMKDMLTGAPGHLLARLQSMAGPEGSGAAQTALRRKAIAAFTMDVGMFYLANGLLQSGLQVLRNTPTMGLGPAAQQTFNEWYDETASAIKSTASNPLSIFGVLPQHWNEPGKQDRVFAGMDDQNRGIYLRLPAGKVGEEFLGWFSKPATMLVNKASPLVRPIIEDVIGYDSLGRGIYKPNAATLGDVFGNVGRAVQHVAENLGPTSTIEGAAELGKHYVTGQPLKGDEGVSLMKMLGPATGLAQVSSGYPGGPAAGEMHAQSERERFELQKALPAIREKIKTGDTEGAVKDMVDLNVPPGLRRYYLRSTLNPGMSRAQIKRLPNAPGDVQERVRRQLGQQP